MSPKPGAASTVFRTMSTERHLVALTASRIKLSDMAKHGWEGRGAVAKFARGLSYPQQEPLDIDLKRTSKLG